MRVSRRAINGLSRREFLIMTSMAATSRILETGHRSILVKDDRENIIGLFRILPPELDLGALLLRRPPNSA